ncbi:MAG TPA: SCP2 sterol-binding domain-containing protein [Xanthobacteraceae bacterium]|nr:SCP2 sterol-binding domain-containing protein [Xanthobacteraceae bacterium]
MHTASHSDPHQHDVRLPLPGVVNFLLRPIPLPLLRFFFNPVAAHIAKTRPELFARLDTHASKRFLIDPVDLPFGLVLAPDPVRPALEPFRREQPPHHDARIAGSFLDLFGLIDGSADGDALFFSRELQISGDTEAVVALRNALDDMEGSIVDNVSEAFGILSKPAALVISALRTLRARSVHA